jgi:hypothetical protein
MQPITQEYDASTDILTIEGVKYSGELFRQFAKEMPIGAPFRIVKRENGKTARKFRSVDAVQECESSPRINHTINSYASVWRNDSNNKQSHVNRWEACFSGT